MQHKAWESCCFLLKAYQPENQDSAYKNATRNFVVGAAREWLGRSCNHFLGMPSLAFTDVDKFKRTNIIDDKTSAMLLEQDKEKFERVLKRAKERFKECEVIRKSLHSCKQIHKDAANGKYVDLAFIDTCNQFNVRIANWLANTVFDPNGAVVAFTFCLNRDASFLEHAIPVIDESIDEGSYFKHEKQIAESVPVVSVVN